ncbi:pseudouridine synthase [Permianibacter sp. IMCC34836]|uniref:23S rRNA pseudouridine(2605) synthase RluB n=1 Tax=Permianibacter fluminis TaxID=2738515 RepID=UPI001553CB77|nr:pseudouridine synthase [Permianibacter fluminis]NQD37098.1 pseudouridine synthase [Permianibacter fluminis]
MSEKLQKVLARAGLGSRREIETWIEDGRLMVNGYPALLGTRVEPKDEVKLDGRRLKLIPESLVNRKILMYHKPEGEVTTRKDPEGRPTVFDRLPPMRGSRWVAIGRLDLNTSGLLIFTNDGEMANRLMHPSHEVEREYAVRILGELKPSQRKQLLEGVVLEDGLAKFNSIESRGGSGTNRWYHVTLSEGRTREVRRMFESLQLVVSRLIRVRYGPVSLDPLLKQGMNRLLTLEESDRLCEAVGIEPQAPRAERRRDYQQSRRSEPVRGRADGDDAFDDDVAPVSSRKPRVIGSKADELPLDRVERAAELLRRRREAESAGVEFSGRSGRLSGKRTLRESELRKIAQEKAAEKAKRAGGKTAATRADGDERDTPRTRTRSAATDETRARPVAPGARSAASRIASTRSAETRSSTARDTESRSSSTRSASTRSAPTSRSASGRTATRTGLARSTSYAERNDDEAAPRRSTRTVSRTRSADDEAPRRAPRAAARSSEDEAPRRRSAKPTGARTAASTRGTRSDSRRTDDRRTEDSPRSARSRAADSDRPARSRSATASDRPSRASGTRTTSRTGVGKSSASRSDSARGSARSGETRSRTAAKPAARTAGKSANASSRSGSARSASERGGSRTAGKTANKGKPAGKGKRTR